MASTLIGLSTTLPVHADLLDRATRGDAELLTVDQAFHVNADRIGARAVEVAFVIAPGTYLYQERMQIELSAPAGATLDMPLPDGTPKYDEHFGDVHIYRDQLLLTGTLDTPGPVTVRIRYQGCADAGLCYPPQTRSFTLAAGS